MSLRAATSGSRLMGIVLGALALVHATGSSGAGGVAIADAKAAEVALNWPLTQEQPESIKRKDFTPLGVFDFKRFGFNIYRASLWMAAQSELKDPQAQTQASSAVKLNWREQGCILSIEYAMDFAKELLIKKSIEEMLGQQRFSVEQQDRWSTLLNRSLVDVRAKDRLVAVWVPNTTVIGNLTGVPASNPPQQVESHADKPAPENRASSQARLQLWYQAREGSAPLKLPEIRDPDLAYRFMAIWLSRQTSQPRMREALLGLSSDDGAGRERPGGRD